VPAAGRAWVWGEENHGECIFWSIMVAFFKLDPSRANCMELGYLLLHNLSTR